MKQSGGIYGPNNVVTHYQIVAEKGERSVITFGSEEKPGAHPMYVEDLLRHIHHPYYVHKPKDGWRTEFTAEEKAKLRPIAETLAMLDGNAFFGTTKPGEKEWYEAYLPEAYTLYESNGGDSGWAGEASFANTKA